MATARLGYVVRYCDDLEAVVAFYRDVLAQTCTKRTEHWAQFECGTVRLGLYQRGAMAAALGVSAGALGSTPGATELAFEVDDVDAAHAAAVAAGARDFAAPADRPWGERTAYVLDPGGGIVELFTRTASRSEAAEQAQGAVAAGADRAEAAHAREMATPPPEGHVLPDPTP